MDSHYSGGEQLLSPSCAHKAFSNTRDGRQTGPLRRQSSTTLNQLLDGCAIILVSNAIKARLLTEIVLLQQRQAPIPLSPSRPDPAQAARISDSHRSDLQNILTRAVSPPHCYPRTTSPPHAPSIRRPRHAPRSPSARHQPLSSIRSEFQTWYHFSLTWPFFFFHPLLAPLVACTLLSPCRARRLSKLPTFKFPVHRPKNATSDISNIPNLIFPHPFFYLPRIRMEIRGFGTTALEMH